MDTKFLNIKLKQRADTKSNWQSSNPVLMLGEIGFELDADYTGQYKVGNGTNRWNDLPYAFQEISSMSTKKVNIVPVTSSLTLSKALHEDSVLLVTSDKVEITIPTIENGFSCTIKNVNSNPCNVMPSSSVTVDGKTGGIPLAQYEFIKIVQHGTNTYYVINTNKTIIHDLGDLSVTDSVLTSLE